METKKLWSIGQVEAEEIKYKRGQTSASPCANTTFSRKASLKKTSLETGQYFLLVYLDHENKETLNWLNI